MRGWPSLFLLLLACGCAKVTKPVAPWDSFRVNNAYAIFADKLVAELAVAGAKGDIKTIDRLVAASVNVNATGEYGQTPLFWSLYAHNKVGFQKLLESGADPNAIEKLGEGIMHKAAADEDPDYLRLALMHGGNPNLVDPVRNVNPTPIFFAMQPIRSENLNLLIASGADIGFRSGSKETPLHYAVAIRQYDKAYILLKSGADYRAADDVGHTIVTYIERFPFDRLQDTGDWREKVIDFLHQHGVEVHPRNP